MRLRAIPETTLWQALTERADAAGEDIVISGSTGDLTAARLRAAAVDMAGRLAARGIEPGARVMTMLPNSAAHATLLFALARLGAVWAAIAPDVKGPVLDHIVARLKPDLVVAAPGAIDAVISAGVDQTTCVAYDGDDEAFMDAVFASKITTPAHKAHPRDVRAIVFTSGTTGPPKGALVTERMLVASAWGAAHAADATAGDRFLLWEPLYHIGGSQMLVLAALMPVRLFVTPGFSASRFWDGVRANGITKIHYLGGILEILLAQPESAKDREHGVSLGFGAGARADIAQAFEKRFNIRLREVYGLTEASSFTTINFENDAGSIGRPLPWMAVELLDNDGRMVPPGTPGEIVIRPKVPGLLTPGYLDDPAATAALVRGNRLYSGDLGRQDRTGAFYFTGRKKDAIRHRGEIISAWEVETALLAHPDIAECAALGVPAGIGEEEILVFIRAAPGVLPDLPALADWAIEHLARRSRPRYWRVVEEFPRTPSARIAKRALARDTKGAFDAGENST